MVAVIGLIIVLLINYNTQLEMKIYINMKTLTGILCYFYYKVGNWYILSGSIKFLWFFILYIFSALISNSIDELYNPVNNLHLSKMSISQIIANKSYKNNWIMLYANPII